MRRFFAKNLLFVLAVNLLVKPLWIFMIDRTVQNRVGYASYGTYQALFNMGIIFQIILDFGLTNYNTRLIARNPERLKQFFPTMLAAKLLLILVYGAIVGCAGWFFGYSNSELVLLGGILMIQVLTATMQFVRSNVAALHRFKLDSLLSVADRLLMILLCGTLLILPATKDIFKIEWFVACQVVCYSIAVVMGFYILRRIAKVPIAINMDRARVWRIIKESAPYALLVFLMSVYTRSDMIFLERLLGEHGKEQAGIYASAYRLLDVGNIFGLMFAGLLLPLFGRMLINKEQGHISSIIALCVNVMLPFSFIVAITAGFWGNDIMHLLYHRAGTTDGTVFALLMGSFPAFCVMYIYSTLLTAQGALKLLNKIAAGGVVINITLNLLLIPQFEAMGAAAAAFLTQTMLAGCFIIFAKRGMQLPTNIKWIMAHACFPLSLAIVAEGLIRTNLQWPIQVMLLIACGGLMIFFFRFIAVKSIKQLLLNK